jgi:hypothetical protein
MRDPEAKTLKCAGGKEMPHSSAGKAPTTVGELRRALEKLGYPWMADPRFSDDEPIPDRPRGGQPDADVPAQHRIVVVRKFNQSLTGARSYSW